jgi:bifunctional DNA-binding transcriptional regulator/antitoxin component of YhaV-PrlF toxin-antitoxin module
MRVNAPNVGATLTAWLESWKFQQRDVLTMSIIRVKDKYQLTLPAELRQEAGIEVGDIVDARWEKGKITLTPKTIVDRIPASVKALRADAKRKGLDKITMDEIDGEVAAVRTGQQRKRKPSNRRRS